MNRLADGSDAWFVRVRGGVQYTLQPCSRAGWMVIGAYLVVTVLATLILFPEPNMLRWILWGTVEVAATVLMLVTAFRKSAPLPKP